ncbi:MAG: SpoIID/LytB domain-containing protein [Bacteroides sp.]|nr:SpoIID/LytB domain-containing protein [Bacteroides sp.]MCM1548598.1 SpoIID/LytB domain-containing protein [Clostridium sp.]
MKKGSKIGIILAAVLVMAGIAGAIWIRYFFFRVVQPDAYYGRQEAESMLELLQEGNPVLEVEPGDSSGFTMEDGKQALELMLGFEEEQWKVLIQEDTEAETAIGFLWQEKAEKYLSREEFQHFYEYLVTKTGTEQVRVEALYVLDVIEEELEDGSHPLSIITPEQRYRVAAMSEEGQERLEEQLRASEDRIIRVYRTEQQIFDSTGEGTEGVTLSNVWVEDSNESEVHLFINGYHKTLGCNLSADENPEGLSGSLADIRVTAQGITDIILKSDVITAKVLSVSPEGVELENYGMLGLSEHYRIYKIYGELAVEPTSQILVGYSSTNFVVADGVIEAALITEPIRAENIRVVLGNSDYTSLIHSSVRITADCSYTMKFSGQTKVFEAGEELELNLTCGYMAEGRVVLSPKEENGKLQISSITRNGVAPSYRGTIEVAPYGDSGLTIVNELSMEEYLYTVVPSEMPTSYGQEALQVQAICARGYAYAKMLDGSYAKYGAHLDDSTMTQVYNAVAESEESILAVKDTYGMVPFYNGEVIEAYFFSTSCGTTSNNSDVWDGEPLPYLTDKLECDNAPVVDFSEEAAFRDFMTDSSGYNTYEKDYSLYRWDIEYTPEEMTAAIQETLAQRYETNPDRIRTLQPDGTYMSQPVSSIGTVQDISVTLRGKSGIVKEITIIGSQGTIQVTGQTNARALMTPAGVTIHRQDGAESVGWSLLPSPFYYVEKNEAGNFIIVGGGFGHGVGMSQNGTKAMTELGYSAEEIIQHYYTGVEIRNIYQ